jgi:hypothetical protein
MVGGWAAFLRRAGDRVRSSRPGEPGRLGPAFDPDQSPDRSGEPLRVLGDGLISRVERLDASYGPHLGPSRRRVPPRGDLPPGNGSRAVYRRVRDGEDSMGRTIDTSRTDRDGAEMARNSRWGGRRWRIGQSMTAARPPSSSSLTTFTASDAAFRLASETPTTSASIAAISRTATATYGRDHTENHRHPGPIGPVSCKIPPR